MYGNISHGRKVVAAAGTPERLAAAQTRSGFVRITALPSNTGIVAIGGPTVNATPGTESGIVLDAGQFVELHMDDIGSLYIDAETNGEGVAYGSLS